MCSIALHIVAIRTGSQTFSEVPALSSFLTLHDLKVMARVGKNVLIPVYTYTTAESEVPESSFYAYL